MSAQTSSSPLISIVTPVYNAEKFLAQTLQSVQSQTYHNWEQLLIIDANTADRSLEVASEFAKKDSRFKVFVSPEFRGVTRNRNAALERARGSFIAFLDADDLWSPLKLEKQLSYMIGTKAQISCHHYIPMNEKGEPLGTLRKAPLETSFQDLLKDNTMGCLTVMLRKDFLANRRFEEIKHEDLALWLELLRAGEKCKGLQEPLAHYRVLQSSVSSNKLKAAIWRWRIYKSLNISMISSLYYLAIYLWTAVQKRIFRSHNQS